jgi:glycerol-3-phosphate O-acyltransferase 3/4
MIDYIILTAYSPFAVIMQLHPGWVGFMQTKVLNCLGCLWFNRSEARAPWPLSLLRSMDHRALTF